MNDIDEQDLTDRFDRAVDAHTRYKKSRDQTAEYREEYLAATNELLEPHPNMLTPFCTEIEEPNRQTVFRQMTTWRRRFAKKTAEQ